MQQGNLAIHKLSKHDGVKYYCDLCDHESIKQDHLARDSQNMMECDFQAKWQNYLVTHKLSKHDGVKYSCDLCTYQATYQVNLVTHK